MRLARQTAALVAAFGLVATLGVRAAEAPVEVEIESDVDSSPNYGYMNASLHEMAVLINQEMQASGSDKALVDALVDEYQPLCLLVVPAFAAGLQCPLIAIAGSTLYRNSPDFTKLTTAGQITAPTDLPHPLVDLRGANLPQVVPANIVAQEKPTYAWYLRHVFNMYDYVYKYIDYTRGVFMDNDDMPAEYQPVLPDGCTNQRVYYVTEKSGYTWPLGQSVVKGDTLIFFIRGTMFPENWVTDFSYDWAPVNQTRKAGLPGRVHRGFFEAAAGMFRRFEGKVAPTQLKKVVLAGHSMGAAVAVMGGAYFANRYPNLEVEVVALACPMVGDLEFANYLNDRVNLRQVTYLGTNLGRAPGLSGWRQPVLGFGDAVPQMPPACPGIDSLQLCPGIVPGSEGADVRPKYVLPRGVVPFYATQMKNSAGWIDADRLTILEPRELVRNVMARHICAYTCWASDAVTGVDSACYLSDQKYDEKGQERPKSDVCDMTLVESLTKRFPFLKEKPDTVQPVQRKLRTTGSE